MKPPKELVIECPICETGTSHQVLSGKVEGKKRIVLKTSVKCCACGHIHAVEIVEDKPIKIPIIVSWMEDSMRTTVDLFPLDEIRVGDELYINDNRLVITSLESSRGRQDAARARDIRTIWAKKFDRVKLKLSIDFRGKVYSKELLAVPEEEFIIGDILDVDGREAVITSIRTVKRTLKQGSAAARDIVRIYSKGIRR